MDIVVKGRNVEVPDHYRQHVAEKLHKIERYDHKIIRVDVELFHERNPRQSDHCQRVEITCVSRGPVVRAEACAADFYAALDIAITKLNTRLRRTADRRRVHRGHKTPVSVAVATAPLAQVDSGAWFGRNGNATTTALAGPPAAESSMDAADEYASEYDDQPWHIVREKEHPAEPMTVDDALFHMELLGHDFYLFMDKESGRPSVVYRRHGYDYGVMSLST
ncbi:ribosome hibernation-promoting factor, HPF/YfiA family [Planosporangium mesophilum]|uniref:Ribosome hibernation promoting factor n=1 Tax=Planosporangium mesophilum TaxID=689768 RepID=A0A8J3TDQ7_9ACTN|nr:ribosome-associated translation inhibitor RaiA [Planosporangium mesophilum]NJC84954.1 ribosome-associated translation inhibitor RaiA [Planosporangium mesophilum]GII23576.1 ribosomal subunit interface protein [Planosporangium mesophilum]